MAWYDNAGGPIGPRRISGGASPGGGGGASWQSKALGALGSKIGSKLLGAGLTAATGVGGPFGALAGLLLNEGTSKVPDDEWLKLLGGPLSKSSESYDQITQHATPDVYQNIAGTPDTQQLVSESVAGTEGYTPDYSSIAEGNFGGDAVGLAAKHPDLADGIWASTDGIADPALAAELEKRESIAGTEGKEAVYETVAGKPGSKKLVQKGKKEKKKKVARGADPRANRHKIPTNESGSFSGSFSSELPDTPLQRFVNASTFPKPSIDTNKLPPEVRQQLEEKMRRAGFQAYNKGIWKVPGYQTGTLGASHVDNVDYTALANQANALIEQQQLADHNALRAKHAENPGLFGNVGDFSAQAAPAAAGNQQGVLIPGVKGEEQHVNQHASGGNYQQQARGNVNYLNEQAAANAAIKEKASALGFMGGTHRVPGYNQGQDTVPAMLTPGEAVIPAEAAQNPKNQPLIKGMISEGRQMQGEPQMNFGDDPLGAMNFGYKPSEPGMGAKDMMEMDKMSIQRAKAKQDMGWKEKQMKEAERRKEEAHKLSLMQKQETHAERKGPLAGG